MLSWEFIYLMGLKEKKIQTKNLIICKEIREYYHDVENLVSDLDYVMFLNNKIIGQIIFMKALIKTDEGRNLDVMTIGPISIANDFKRQGYGKILIEYALEKARELGCGAVCLEGNIDFYGKVGFDYAKKYGIRYHGLPENEDSSFFLCKELIKGYLDHTRGEYFTPQGYFLTKRKWMSLTDNFHLRKN
jgi:putative acetyltransferase